MNNYQATETMPRQKAMNAPCGHRSSASRCDALVPSELDSVRLCVFHLTVTIERNCTDLHRQIALRGATQERRSEVAAYVEECVLLLARIATNLTLSDELKRRMLSTFLSLMNLREKNEPKSFPEPRVAKSAVVQTRSVAADVASAGEISTEHAQDPPPSAEESAADDEPRQEYSPGLPEACPEFPLDEEIRDRAHAIYLARGGTRGDDLEDWLRAEREVKEHQRDALSVKSR